MRVPPTNEDIACADRACQGKLDLGGASPPQLISVARALPEIAERAWFDSDALRVRLRGEIMNAIWPGLVALRTVPTAIPWTVTAAAALEALSILRIEALPSLDGFEAADEIRREWRALQRPRIYALLHGGTAPGRVVWSSLPHGKRLGECVRECQQIAQGLFGNSDDRWALDSPAQGHSRMAAYLLRAAADRYPKAFRGVEPIGITGELNFDGVVVPVEPSGIADKVEQFFRHHPNGTCFLPIKNLPDCPRVRKQPLDEHVSRIFPFWNLTELFIRLGAVLPEKSVTSFFEAVRNTAAHKLVDWRQHERALVDLIELSLKVEPGAVATTWPELMLEARLAQHRARLVLQGPPGAGKSFMLRQLHAALSIGALRLDGPSILIRAKDLPDHNSFPTAVSLELQRTSGACRWSNSEIAAFFDIASSPVVSTTWLLIDGLDEVAAARRERVIGFVRKWPGPVCIATRRIREEIAGSRIVNIAPPATQSVYNMLEKEGRRDLVLALSSLQYPSQPRFPASSVVNQLIETPLGVSLLADAVREIDGLTAMTRHVLLGRGIDALLRRAVRERELEEEAVQIFHLETDSALGATAWAMLVSGAEEFSLKDLRQASTSMNLDGNRLQRLLHTVEVGGVVQPSGADCREFVIRSFAEYCAALFLLQAPDRLELLSEGLPYLGEPSINDVFVQVASQGDPDSVIELLLESNDHPITALDLASGLLLDVNAGQLYEDTIVEVMKRRVALETRFARNEEDQVVPLTSGLTLRIIKRFREIASRHIDVLIDASHPGMRAMIEGIPLLLQPFELPCPIHKEHRARGTDFDLVPSGVTSIIELFLELAGRDPPLRTHLFLWSGLWDDDAIKQLQRLYPDRTYELLENLLDDPVSSVRQEALDAWLRLSTDQDIHPRLAEFMERGDNEVISVLRHVASRCGLSIRREAILRFVLNMDLISSSVKVPRELDKFCDCWDSSVHDVDDAWDLAWDSGVLGWLPDPSKNAWMKSDDEREERGIVQALAFAYAYMMDDPRPEARLGALSVWELIERNRWRRPWSDGYLSRTAPALLRDTYCEIRCKVLDFLVERKVLATALPKMLLFSDDDRERWLAWRYLVQSGRQKVNVEDLVRALRPGAFEYEVEGAPILPDGVLRSISWGVDLIDSDGALKALMDAISSEIVEISFVKRLKIMLKRGPNSKEARSLLKHMARRCHRRKCEITVRDAALDAVCELLEQFLPEGWGPPIDDYYDDYDDDSYDDPEWDYNREVQQLLDTIKSAPDLAEARDQLLAKALEGDESLGIALDALERSGGLKPRHKGPIVAHLRDQPGCADALELFFKASGTEKELFDLWKELAVPWLSVLRGSPPGP